MTFSITPTQWHGRIGLYATPIVSDGKVWTYAYALTADESMAEAERIIKSGCTPYPAARLAEVILPDDGSQETPTNAAITAAIIEIERGTP